MAATQNGAVTASLSTVPSTMVLGNFRGVAAESMQGWINYVCMDDGEACGGRGNTVGIIGDSLSSGFGAGPAWKAAFDTLLGYSPVRSTQFAVAGQTTSYFYNTEWLVNAKHPGHFAFVTVEGTDNDAVADLSAATIESSLTSLYTEILAQGSKLVIITTSPWGDNGSWTAPRQAVTAAVRTWQIAYQAAHPSTVLLYDAYTDLGDTDPTKLNPTYSEDGTHRNTAGQARVAAQLKTTMGL